MSQEVSAVRWTVQWFSDYSGNAKQRPPIGGRLVWTGISWHAGILTATYWGLRWSKVKIWTLKETMPHGRPIVFSRFKSNPTFTTLKAELRSRVAISAYSPPSKALAIKDWSCIPAVMVLCLALKPCWGLPVRSILLNNSSFLILSRISLHPHTFTSHYLPRLTLRNYVLAFFPKWK